MVKFFFFIPPFKTVSFEVIARTMSYADDSGHYTVPPYFTNAVLLISSRSRVFYIRIRRFICKFRKNFTLFQKTNRIRRDDRIASIFTAQYAFKSLRPVVVHLRIKQIILCDSIV